MITAPMFLRAGALAATLVFAGCSSMPMMSAMAAPASTSLRATLSAAAEVPANASAGTGSLEATLDKTSRQLRWKLNYTGLGGPATMAHFHGPAMPGANAGVVVPLTSPASPAEGQATLTEAQMADLLAGKWYINVHTAANPGGEIRGQVLVN